MGKDARTFGQDLMRGEHVVGQKPGQKPKKVQLVPGGAGTNSAWIKKPPAFRPNPELDESTQRALGGYMANGAVVDRGEGQATGTSIFDPVLCELTYRWFCPPNGLVLDPFAGGSVRGIVAAKLGRRYVGVELRSEQVAENRKQGAAICPGKPLRWIAGDSLNIAALAKGTMADLVFTCPPYADLEVYSEDPRDISTMPYPQFMQAYENIIRATCGMLRQDRFACVVVGEVRGKDGSYYGFVPDTIRAFQRAGLALYNEAILITAVGSLPIRCGKQFTSSRKLGKTHQNILVFVKGDAKRATQACGPVDIAVGNDLFGEPVPDEPEPARVRIAAPAARKVVVANGKR